MPACRHHDSCGLTDEADPEAGLCILHSANPQKDSRAFDEALHVHRQERGDTFHLMVFPATTHFLGASFLEDVDFTEVRFVQDARFENAKFAKKATFDKAVFAGWADFTSAEFCGEASFIETKIHKRAYFDRTTFRAGALFLRAQFTEAAFFGRAEFTKAASFFGSAFSGLTEFRKTTFAELADFTGCAFSQGAHFGGATFLHRTEFTGTEFCQMAHFGETTFAQEANFSGVLFSQRATFSGAAFSGVTHFLGTQFSGGADFEGIRVAGAKISFHSSRFHGKTLFASRREGGQGFPTFAGVKEVDFRRVVIDPPDAVTFIDIDLTRCQFLDTDLRKVQITGVVWPWMRHWFGGRSCVYDEKLPRPEPTQARWWFIAPRERCNELCTKETTGVCKVCQALEEADRFLWGWLEGCMRGCAGVRRFCRKHILRLPPQGSLPWSQIERLYRELKQNHEDRRDYARAGDFHYGEKEMQRRNPQTPRSLRFFLWLYWRASGYGVCWLRPLVWALVLWVASTGAYLWSRGLLPKSAGAQASSTAPLTITAVGDWLRAAVYSLRVMTFLRPDDLTLNGLDAITVHTIDSLLGPLFLGLFALAISQRLKR